MEITLNQNPIYTMMPFTVALAQPQLLISSEVERCGILIVDDQPIGRESLADVLAAPEYVFYFAANGRQALRIAAEMMPELILLDVMMPGMSGYEVCQHMRTDPKLAEVPILLLTALDDADSRLKGLEAGADDFITKPFNRVELCARVKTIARLARYRKLMSERSNLEQAHAQLITAYDATIESWSRVMELRDRETEGHTRRVANLAVRLGKALGLNEEDLRQLRRGALLHDMGKLGIPDNILLKEGPLTQDEWVIMRQHPKLAYDLLWPVEYLRPAVDVAYAHHEKWDGSGYPRGLKAEAIPLSARIFAVVDVWDALTSRRVYRPAWSEDQAREYISQNAGIHFDPQIIPAFLALL